MKWSGILILLITALSAGCYTVPQPDSNEVEAGTETPSPSEPAGTPSEVATVTETETPSYGRNANADVLFVRAVQSERGSWTFHVTVQHPDTGWEDYADGWDVVLPDGTVVKPDPTSPFTRLLLHPHETEQPFTRSQGGITIPDGVDIVTVRAHDLVDGFGGAEIDVDLTQPAGPGYEVLRSDG